MKNLFVYFLQILRYYRRVMSIILVSLGVSLCFFGIIGFTVVAYFSFQARKSTEASSKDSKKLIFEQLIIVNYLALFVSTFGLIILAIGILLSQ